MTDYKLDERMYLGTTVEVEEPIILQDPNTPIEIDAPARVQITDGIITEVIGIVSILASGGLLWLVRGLKSKLKELSDRVPQDHENSLLPPEEIRRVQDILAQVSILTGADRVTLGVFYNGVIGADGAHYDKLSILVGYCHPGVIPLPEMHKSIKATTLMNDLKPLFQATTDGKNLIIDKETAPSSCSLYMSRRDIYRLHNNLLKVNNLEVGVISIHWCSRVEGDPVEPVREKIKELFTEVKAIIQSSRDKKRILT